MASFIKKPYYMTNEEWYTFDNNNYKHVLTDKATPEAIESYNAFMKSLQEMSCGNISDKNNVLNS